MNPIKNILLCGLGGIGCVCASAIYNAKYGNLKILVDEKRYEIYKLQPTIFNEQILNLDYILPSNKNFQADLIIIATKDDGLKTAIENIKNFINKDTIIISLLNGIHSEKEIEKSFPNNKILISFYIGCSCIRDGRKIKQNGTYELVIGAKDNKDKEALNKIKTFFEKTNIKYKIPEDIQEEYWKKFLINVGVNQLCAATGLNLKEIKNNPKLIEKLKALMQEAKLIAEKEGINNTEKIYTSAENFLLKELDDAYPSMLQDIKAKRKNEVDIFAGVVIQLGEKNNIKTPENKEIYRQIKSKEKDIKFL